MVAEPGGRVLAWNGALAGTRKVSFALKGARASGVENYETLSALGRRFGFGLDEIFSRLIGSTGCKIPGLVWHYRNGRYGSSLFNLSGLVWVR